MDALTYYAEHGPVTDPGKTTERLRDLPDDLAFLRRAALGLVLHYRGDVASPGFPEGRLAEVDSRYAEKMLARIFELDGGPLSEGRTPERRLLGCCRDFTVLLVCMCRHKRIPARARVGFATYFDAGFGVDHEVAEVWEAAEGRWRLVDAQLPDGGFTDATDGADLDPLDVPRDRFLVGGLAWRLCRDGEADPERFLVDPELEIEQTRGWSYLRHNLVHDLAALNKREMVLWDYWGLMEKEPPSGTDLALLDRVARATAEGHVELDRIKSLYKDPRLRVPNSVTSYSPTSLPEPLEVTLEV